MRVSQTATASGYGILERNVRFLFPYAQMVMSVVQLAVYIGFAVRMIPARFWPSERHWAIWFYGDEVPKR